MKNYLKSIVLLAAAAALASCATLKVTTDYDHAKNFSTLKTFAIYQNPKADAQTVSDLNKDRILSAVRSQLAAKGYTEVTANPTFWVNVNTVVKEKQSVSADTDFYGYGGGFRPYGYWGGGVGMVSANTTFNVDDYKDGSIIVDAIDGTTGKLFWESVGNAEIDGQFTNPDQKIQDAITKILATFPTAGNQPAAKK